MNNQIFTQILVCACCPIRLVSCSHENANDPRMAMQIRTKESCALFSGAFVFCQMIWVELYARAQASLHIVEVVSNPKRQILIHKVLPAVLWLIKGVTGHRAQEKIMVIMFIVKLNLFKLNLFDIYIPYTQFD